MAARTLPAAGGERADAVQLAEEDLRTRSESGQVRLATVRLRAIPSRHGYLFQGVSLYGHLPNFNLRNDQGSKQPLLLAHNPGSPLPEYIKRLRASVLRMTASADHLLFAALALGCAAVASVYDVRERRIPNQLTGGSLLAGLLLHLGLGGWHGLGSAAVASLTSGGLFLVFFLAGGMGAGDVKLMAAIGAIAGLAPLQLLILATVLAGGLFALGLAGYHGRLRQTLVNVAALLLHHGREGIRPHPEMNLANERTLRLPFALPIAAGCLVTLCTLAWGVRP